jgi:hypothetical protein
VRKSKTVIEGPLSRRQQLQGLRQAAADGTILTAEQLAFTVGRSLAWVARLRSGGRVCLAYRAWRVADGWQITTVDGTRAVGQPLAPPN